MEWIVIFAVIGVVYYFYQKKRSNNDRTFEASYDYRAHQGFLENSFLLDAGEKPPENEWFQKANQKNKNFVSYRGKWSSDWKYASEHPDDSSVKVGGISRENRSADFLRLAQSDGFTMYLEDDPTNPVNKNARKIMVSATIEGELVAKHIGYLPEKIANRYAGVELKISPREAFIPPSGDLNLGVEVTLLQRSARYLKKKAKKPPKLKKEKLK